jgi:hypothetical protein
MNLLKVSLTCLHFSLMFSEGEVKSPYFLQVLLVAIMATIALFGNSTCLVVSIMLFDWLEF